MIFMKGTDYIKYDQGNFFLDYFSVDWQDLIKNNELNADNSTRMYFDNVTMLLDTYAPLKIEIKHKLKLKV